MATLPIKSILQVTNYSGHHGNLTTEAPNQNFKNGNLLVPDATTGKSIVATAGAGAAAGKLMLAAKDSENTATPRNNALPVVRPIPNMIFEISATGAASTAALLKAGAQYGYAIDATTGFGNLNFADTTNVVFELVQHDGDTLAPNGGVSGDTNVRVYARIIPTKI